MSLLYVDDIRGKTAAASVDLSNATNLKMPAGSVIQTVSGTYTTVGYTNSTSPVQAWSGVSITPKFSTSLIKVECNWYCMHRDYYDGFASIYRNGSAISGMQKVIRNAAHTGTNFISAGSRPIWYCPAWLWSFTEAAGGTSQITYSIHCWTQDTSQDTWWNDASTNSNENPTSTMILSEISQ